MLALCFYMVYYVGSSRGKTPKKVERKKIEKTEIKKEIQKRGLLLLISMI